MTEYNNRRPQVRKFTPEANPSSVPRWIALGLVVAVAALLYVLGIW